MGSGILGKVFRGKEAAFRNLIRIHWCAPSVFQHIEEWSQENVSSFTAEFKIGLEGGRLERVRVLKLRGWLLVQNMKGNSEPPWGFEEREVRAASEKKNGSCVKD